MKYKIRLFKDSAYIRANYYDTDDLEINTYVLKTPDEKAVKMYAPWMINYFTPFGVIKNKNKTSVDVKIYGEVHVKVGKNGNKKNTR